MTQKTSTSGTQQAATESAWEPRPGDAVNLFLRGQKDPISTTVVAVSKHPSRPPSLTLRLSQQMGGSTLNAIEHVSRNDPYGGWDRPA